MSMIGLYLNYARASLKAQMAYPAAFLMTSFGQFLVTIVEFGGLYLLFDRFGRLDQWSLGEVAIFYGLVNLGFSIADTITRGFDVFGPEFVKTGNFDRLLLRPRSLALQLFGYEFRLTRIGRTLQAVVVLLFGASLIDFAWTSEAIAIVGLTVAGCVAFFSALLVLQATLAIWTVESLEIVNVFTYGGVYAGQAPMNIYARWLRDFLTYVVPLSCVAYFPVLALLGKAHIEGMTAPAAAMTPLIGFLFFGFSLWVWGFGVRRYTSTGS